MTGYARVVLVLLSFHYMPFSPGITVLLYMTSEILDALDGYTARRFNQCKLQLHNIIVKMQLHDVV